MLRQSRGGEADARICRRAPMFCDLPPIARAIARAVFGPLVCPWDPHGFIVHAEHLADLAL